MGINNLTSAAKQFVARAGEQIERTGTTSTGELMHDFLAKLSPQAKYDTYSKEVKCAISDFVQNGDTKANSYIKTLIDNNAAGNDILDLLRNPENFKIYRAIKSQLNKLLKNVKFGNSDEKSIFSQNLSLLRIKDKISFRNIVESKGFQEVIDGNLSAEYIKGLTSNDKIGYNHFYDMFASIEKATDARLSKIPGLDKEKVLDLIRAMDEKICKSPRELSSLLEVIERHKNPEKINKILSLCSNDIKEGHFWHIKDLIFATNYYPKAFDYVLKYYDGIASHSASDLLFDTCVISNRNKKIDKELLEFLFKNKDKYNHFRISEIDNFLSINGSNKDILIKYMDVLNGLKNKTKIPYNLNQSVSENNFGYFKKLLEENKINEDSFFKLLITSGDKRFENPKNWAIADKVYEETFLPLFKSTNNPYRALDITGMRIYNPECYKKLKDIGMLDLVLDKKLTPEILRLEKGQEFLPEIYEDIELLKNGKGLIKHFTSFDKILSRTSAGDVVSVNGKIFINNRGKLEPWNMTEKKFNELFPLVERFAGTQGPKDCFLYSAMESMYRNPKTRGQYYKLFEQKGDDILVTIPAYKNFKGTIKFRNGDLVTATESGKGAKHHLMLEQAFARTAVRKEATTPIGKNPLTTDDLEYLYERLNGGQTGDALRDLFDFNPNLIHLKTNKRLVKGVQELVFEKPEPQKVKKILDNFGNNPKLMINLGVKSDTVYHAISIKSYDPKTGIIEIIDPIRTCAYSKLNINELSPNVVKMWFTSI